MVVNPIEVVFFDIGGTLGERNLTGDFTAFPNSRKLLSVLHDTIGLRIGVITSLGDLTDHEGRDLLEQADLANFLDPQGFVSEYGNGGAAKPNSSMYQAAATRVGVPVEKCLYVGENLIEVIGALAAGMQALLKPCPPGLEMGN
jgi:FMN phosphatase YigB (HAD superfamily)